MRKVLLVVAGAFGLATMLFAGSANAQAAFPTKALTLSTWMARAYDQCIPTGLSVVVPGVTDTACLAANSATDGVTNMNFARVRVTRNPAKIRVYGRGFTFGDVVRVRLHLRVTKAGVQTKHPNAIGQKVTFADETVDCPRTPDAFTVRPNGALAASTDLAACLTPNTGLAGTLSKSTNIEILSVSLVNAVSGKEIGHSGVVR